MSKKIFIITGESSGDKIASLVIKKIKEKSPSVQFLAIGGESIKSEKIDCVFDIQEIAKNLTSGFFSCIFLINREAILSPEDSPVIINIFLDNL